MPVLVAWAVDGRMPVWVDELLQVRKEWSLWPYSKDVIWEEEEFFWLEAECRGLR